VPPLRENIAAVHHDGRRRRAKVPLRSLVATAGFVVFSATAVWAIGAVTLPVPADATTTSFCEVSVGAVVPSYTVNEGASGFDVSAIDLTGFPDGCDGATVVLQLWGNVAGDPSTPLVSDTLLSTADSTTDPCTGIPRAMPKTVSSEAIHLPLCPTGGPGTYASLHDLTALVLIVNGASVTLPAATPPGGTPQLAGQMNSTPMAGSKVRPRSKVTYTVTLQNSGTAPASGVAVSDAVPTGTRFLDGSASCNGAAGCSASEVANVVTWSGLSVAANTSVALTFKVTVDANDVDKFPIVNLASFTNRGDQGCSTPTCATNAVTLTVSAFPVAGRQLSSSGPVPGAVKPHTGEPWAGSLPISLGILCFGLGLLVVGALGRRRNRRLAATALQGE
jgi:uncharacterized repeat protein (TIGR01451 family)